MKVKEVTHGISLGVEGSGKMDKDGTDNDFLLTAKYSGFWRFRKTALHSVRSALRRTSFMK